MRENFGEKTVVNTEESKERYFTNFIEPIKDWSEEMGARLENDWDDRLIQAKNLAELKRAVAKAPVIIGSRKYTPNEVLHAIISSENWQDDHMEEVVLGVLTGGHWAVRDELGRLTNLITRAGDLDIRGRVRDFMKAEMEEYFLKNTPELARKAIAEMTSLPALQKLIKQFRYIRDDDGKEVWQGEGQGQLGSIISGAKTEFEVKLKAGYWQKLRKGDDVVELYKMLREYNVPTGAGLRDKMMFIMAEEIRRRKAEAQASSTLGRTGSWFSNIRKKVGSWWRR